MKKKVYDKNHKCRICGKENFSQIIDLGEQTITSSFPWPEESDPPRSPLVLVKCCNCGLVQLEDTVKSEILYTHDYGYRSGINDTMSQHLKGITSKLEDIVNFKEGDVVLDIGCNDGTLLKSYQISGLNKYGIDPIVEHFLDFYPDDIEVYEGFFNKENYEKATSGTKAKAITSIAMFYDLPDPGQFVIDIGDCLAENGVWVLEQSYMPTMLEMNSFDTVCHEHLEYYDLKSIMNMANDASLKVFDVELNESNGGSFRIFVCHKSSPYIVNKKSINKLLDRENILESNGMIEFEQFKQRVNSMRENLVNFIKNEVNKGKKIYIYGASTKGNTLLQYYGLDSNLITAAADRNPEKWGRVTPNTRIPIISEEEARRSMPDYFLVLPWHFKDNFIERESDFLEAGGHFIFPLPEFVIV
jgi:NDP-4-keto-2,6-dideoxyhexose 3-C-methyltransferase